MRQRSGSHHLVCRRCVYTASCSRVWDVQSKMGFSFILGKGKFVHAFLNRPSGNPSDFHFLLQLFPFLPPSSKTIKKASMSEKQLADTRLEADIMLHLSGAHLIYCFSVPYSSSTIGGFSHQNMSCDQRLVHPPPSQCMSHCRHPVFVPRRAQGLQAIRKWYASSQPNT